MLQVKELMKIEPINNGFSQQELSSIQGLGAKSQLSCIYVDEMTGLKSESLFLLLTTIVSNSFGECSVGAKGKHSKCEEYFSCADFKSFIDLVEWAFHFPHDFRIEKGTLTSTQNSFVENVIQYRLHM